MKKTKFTPGPWVAMNGSRDIFGPLGGDSGDGFLADDDDGWQVAEVGDYLTFAEGQATELGAECRAANAHLIAAAPELYSVLETAVMQGERILNGKPPAEGEDFDGWFLAAKAALAKARGEQP